MVKRVFIYGRFLGEEDARVSTPPFLRPLFPAPPASELPTEALEILREPSVLELIGRVYVLTSSRNYQPVSPLGVRNFTWYQQYQNASKKREKFYFMAQDGDFWQVPWLRQESDDSGAYIAAALKHD